MSRHARASSGTTQRRPRAGHRDRASVEHGHQRQPNAARHVTLSVTREYGRPMSALTFDGDVIVVTGAGGGMGRCHALELARRGARVVVNDLGGHPFGGGSDAGLATAVVDEIRAAGGEAVANTESVATPEGAASETLPEYESRSRSPVAGPSTSPR